LPDGADVVDNLTLHGVISVAESLLGMMSRIHSLDRFYHEAAVVLAVG